MAGDTTRLALCEPSAIFGRLSRRNVLSTRDLFLAVVGFQASSLGSQTGTPRSLIDTLNIIASNSSAEEPLTTGLATLMPRSQPCQLTGLPPKGPGHRQRPAGGTCRPSEAETPNLNCWCADSCTLRDFDTELQPSRCQGSAGRQTLSSVRRSWQYLLTAATGTGARLIMFRQRPTPAIGRRRFFGISAVTETPTVNSKPPWPDGAASFGEHESADDCALAIAAEVSRLRNLRTGQVSQPEQQLAVLSTSRGARVAYRGNDAVFFACLQRCDDLFTYGLGNRGGKAFPTCR